MDGTSNIVTVADPPVGEIRIGNLILSDARPGKLFSALAKAQAAMPAIPKTRQNTFFKGADGKPSLYADLSDVIEVVKQHLPAQELAWIQGPALENGEVSVTTLIGHGSGEWAACTVAAKPKDNGPQAVGSAITYLRRYGLPAMVGAVSEIDDDANAADGKQAPPPANGSRPPANVKEAKDSPAANGRGLSQRRQAWDAFMQALDGASNLAEATDIWLENAALLRDVPKLTLGEALNLWRSRSKEDPPAIDGVDYPPRKG